MGIRTVRLDDETEKVLRDIQAASDMPISTAFKRGLRALRDQLIAARGTNAWDVYAALDLGPGGYARGPSTETSATAKRVIREKARRR